MSKTLLQSKVFKKTKIKSKCAIVYQFSVEKSYFTTCVLLFHFALKMENISLCATPPVAAQTVESANQSCAPCTRIIFHYIIPQEIRR